MNLEEKYKIYTEKCRQAEKGGGDDRIAKQHAEGKKTARERIIDLLDPGSFSELDKLVVHRTNDFGMGENKIPGDGMVTGYGKIDGRTVFVFAQDFTVFGGTMSRANADKVVKVMQMAMKMGAPVIGLNDSGGARIQEGVQSLAGYADIFQLNVKASGVIPQISAILGPCAGGAVYSPALTDFILMVKEKSYMFVTGPEVIKAVTHEEVTKEDLGGAFTHNSQSGVAHMMADDDEQAMMMIRELIGFLPSNNLEDPPVKPITDEVTREDEKLQTLIPVDPNKPYDMKELLLS
ncbi:MAG TPA: carboxyl transferase domain-containing protein, partial [Bacteroidales bacterium]|nr:carboxyl transferase domain-containing protein [Bacteroidales bacterium]